MEEQKAKSERKTFLIRASDQREGACSACGAALVWTITALGRRMPMNKGFATAAYEPREGITLLQVYADESHWATCTHAVRFKRRGKA